MTDLFIIGHPVLRPPIVLGQQKTMICGQDQCRVLPKIMRVKIVQKPPKIFVAHRDKGCVIAANGRDLFWRVCILLI